MCGEVAERSKALRQGRNLFGGVGSNPTLVTVLLVGWLLVVDRMAEWSKAPDSSSGLFGGAGSNPAPVRHLDAALTPSAVVQWLGYLAFTQETRVQTPAAEQFVAKLRRRQGSNLRMQSTLA